MKENPLLCAIAGTLCFFGMGAMLKAANAEAAHRLDCYNAVWNSQSKMSPDSMPVGGGDIGLNIWVENNELLFYIGRSGTFDENNQMLKLGRVRIKATPNPFSQDGEFQQKLKLRQGYIEITGSNPGTVGAAVKVWVEVFRPVIHVELESDTPVVMEAQYECWRTAPRELQDGKVHRTSCFSMVGYPGRVLTYPDSVAFDGNGVLWYHRNNNDDLVFDKDVHEQGLDKVKDRLWNPLKDLTFGGLMTGTEMVPAGTSNGRYVDTNFTALKLRSSKPAKTHELKLFLHTAQTASLDDWKKQLHQLATADRPNSAQAFRKNLIWWQRFWDRSHIVLNPDQPDPNDKVWQIGRNYQLFRYMLGCNAYGEYPSKFNGSLFTTDPGFMGDKYGQGETPDFRAWGGGSFTAQNQRLVYWPMLKSGDFDMMPSQFDFYGRALGAAEIRTKIYWGHQGCSFTEQIEQFGLPIGSHYGWTGSPIERRNRPRDFEFGVQVNTSCRYEFVHQLDFAFMILEYFRFSGTDISGYMPFIESAVTFYDQHYQFRCKQLTGKPLDENGHLVIYPSTGGESYVGARNPADSIAGLKAVLSRMLELPERYGPPEKKEQWQAMLKRVPPLPVREIEGRSILSPAVSWTKFQCGEITQLYSVFPFGLYGIGKPDLQLAIDTWRYDDLLGDRDMDEDLREGPRNYICWYQGPIFTARLGLTDEAKHYALRKLTHQSRRYPAFWINPGFDQEPDVDHGGSAMIALQEMLMQTDGKNIYLFAAWPKDWDVDFKIHAPYQTIVEGALRKGKIETLKVKPKERRRDVVIMEPR
ncbi:MAG TPA: DUF5703 domain-containing protein [Sedimentisphaerales bacterium]|nr:DUF5703 domain-containing protein [Sedimentisphaerales bacterium]